MVERKLITLDIKLPANMISFGHIITKEQKYIIIMGGACNNQESDKIQIFNLKSMKFIQSKIRLSFEGECGSVIMENKQENDLLGPRIY